MPYEMRAPTWRPQIYGLRLVKYIGRSLTRLNLQLQTLNTLFALTLFGGSLSRSTLSGRCLLTANTCHALRKRLRTQTASRIIRNLCTRRLRMLPMFRQAVRKRWYIRPINPWYHFGLLELKERLHIGHRFQLLIDI